MHSAWYAKGREGDFVVAINSPSSLSRPERWTTGFRYSRPYCHDAANTSLIMSMAARLRLVVRYTACSGDQHKSSGNRPLPGPWHSCYQRGKLSDKTRGYIRWLDEAVYRFQGVRKANLSYCSCVGDRHGLCQMHVKKLVWLIFLFCVWLMRMPMKLRSSRNISLSAAWYLLSNCWRRRPGIFSLDWNWYMTSFSGLDGKPAVLRILRHASATSPQNIYWRMPDIWITPTTPQPTTHNPRPTTNAPHNL